jgi:threonine/homoserine/homoserine lactone efflux protein
MHAARLVAVSFAAGSSDPMVQLFDLPTLLAYLAAAAVLVLIPGPGTAWIVAQTVAGGTRRGLQAGLGLETATLIHALAAGFGLSALLAASAVAFETLKYAGAAYLVWLGVKAWRERPAAPATTTTSATTTEALTRAGGQVYRRSVVTGVLNPKVALFFLAFLPQFVHPERGLAWLQFLVLGALLSTIGFANSATLAFLVGRFGRGVSRSPRLARWRQRAIGTVFVTIGLRLALQQRG